MRENIARMRRPKKIMASADRLAKAPEPISELLREAVARAAKGERDEADVLLRAIRVLESDRAAAATLFAELPAKQKNSTRNTSHLLTRLFDKAVQAHQANDFERAEPLYRAILLLAPSHAMVWSNLAAILTQSGDADEAIAACRKALDLSPNHLNAQINLAAALQRKGLFDEAIATFHQILTYHPNRLDLRRALGSVLELAGRAEEALLVYEEWIEIAPESADAHMAKAEALKKLDRVDEAIGSYARVAAIDPDNAVAYSSMGILMALHSLSNDLDEAASLCLRAAALKPDSPPILNNLGVVLHLRGDLENALLVLEGLTRIDPDFAAAYSNIGSIKAARGRYDEAEDALERALVLDDTRKEAKIELTKVRRNICNWNHLEADDKTIRDLTGSVTNFMIVMMSSSTSAEEQLAYARTAMARYNDSSVRIGRHRSPRGKSRIKLGYISADFKDHPVGRLIPDLIAHHDRQSFEVFGYSLGAGDQSALRQRLAASFDRFIDFRRMSDAEAAKHILDDEIDILIDLTGPTADSRFEILSLRPAPVQVNFLGMPGTAGADCIDYIIADHFLAPSNHERFFHEAIVRLPDCYQPGDTARKLLSPLPSRSDCGLPDEGFVFCSFNSPVKITPGVFAIWMRLLKSVEGSVLWLYVKTPRTGHNLMTQAERAGVDPRRIIFAGAAPFDVYLTRMACADLFLDTYPYAAGATANDALWAGLPILTCAGETYTSRMAGSLLNTLGLPELITSSLEDYERTALDLATNVEKLGVLRRRLAHKRDDSQLFDMTRFTRSMEEAYRTMVLRADCGESPRSIEVAPQTIGN